MHNIVSAADLHDVYSIVINAAQQNIAEELALATSKHEILQLLAQQQQIHAALLQFSSTGDAYALHTALSNINYNNSALDDALQNISLYVSVV
jgi:hypothetical protein